MNIIKATFYYVFIALVLSACSQSIEEVNITHNVTGGIAGEIEKENIPRNISRLVIAGDAILNSEDCKIIRKKFSNVRIEEFNLEGAKFKYDFIPDSEEGVFSNMKMQKLILSDSIKSIGTKAFASCKQLKQIYLPKKLYKIKKEAFRNCTNLQIRELPESVEFIEDAAFENCSKLALNKLPDNLTHYISTRSFANTQVSISEIPKHIRVIQDNAFQNTKITEIFLPYGLEEIGSKVFANCSLQEISLKDPIFPWTDNTKKFSTFKGVRLSEVTLFVPSGSSNNIVNAPWTKMKKIFEVNDLRISDSIINPRRYKTTIDNRNREYLLYLPQNDSIKKPDGMIVLLHGIEETMFNIIKRNNIMMIADDINMVLLAPQAFPIQEKKIKNTIAQFYSSEFENSTVWNSGIGLKGVSNGKTIFNYRVNKSVDDLNFINQIIDKITKDNFINKDNIFILGTSMGGCMAYQYALHYGSELAGLINIAGTMGTNSDTANVKVSLPILDIHNTSDFIVPYSGIQEVTFDRLKTNIIIGMPVEETLRYWSRKNGCSPKKIENLGTASRVSVEKLTFFHQKNPITHFKITGGIHTTELIYPKHPISYRNEVLSFILSHKK